MNLTETKTHACLSFRSLGEFTSWSKHADDNVTNRMRDRAEWHGGISSMKETLALADTGMVREGIEALALSEVERDREIVSQQFQTAYSVSGCDVDVARYLSGEPENMIDYTMADVSRTERIATLVVGVGVAGGTRVEVIRNHGRKLVALAEAIDAAAMQSEIWVEFTTGSPGKLSARIAVRIKAPGEPFDPGAAMFALTHPAFYRGMLFNACHALPDKFVSGLSIGGSYGKCVYRYVHSEDYPDGAIYIPPIDYQADTARHIDRVLTALDLLA
ncbi:MAG: DUF7192 family protein [Mycobacterium sp.]